MGRVISMQSKQTNRNPMESKAFDRLKQEWNENPVTVLVAVSVTFTALSRFVNAVSGIRSRQAYAKDVKRRTKAK